jgi:hypothetical protein
MGTELAQDKAKWCDSLNRVMKYVFRINRKFLDHRSSGKLLKQFFVMKLHVMSNHLVMENYI